MRQFSKILFIFAGFCLISGVIFYLWGNNLKKIFHSIPLNFKWEGKNWKIYFPFGFWIIISVILTIILNIIMRFFRK